MYDQKHDLPFSSKKPETSLREKMLRNANKLIKFLITCFLFCGTLFVILAVARQEEQQEKKIEWNDRRKANVRNLYGNNEVVKLVKPQRAESIYSGTEILHHKLNKTSDLLKTIASSVKQGTNQFKKKKKDEKLSMIHRAQEGMGTPKLDLTQLLALNSSWDSSTGFSNTTIILNHWKRDSLKAQLNAILDLTVQPAYVWVCVFDSPYLERYREIVDEYKNRFKQGVLTLTQSEFNFKYYGRFQIALQAWTDHVWVIDDDILPGPKMLAILTHTLNVHELRAGVLGTIGWIMPPLDEKYRQFNSYRSSTAKGGLYFEDPHYGIRIDLLTAADLVCSHWFLRVDHVKLLFRDKWLTPDTAEDYMLSYSLRRYANLESFVLPSIESDPSTWGNLDIEQALSAEAATTVGDMITVRDKIWWELVQRGGKYHWLMFRNYMRSQPGFFERQREIDRVHEKKNTPATDDKTRFPPAFSVAIFMDGIDDAEALADFHNMVGTVWDALVTQELVTIITGGVRGDCGSMVERLPLFQKHQKEICIGDHFGLFDMNLGAAYDQNFTPTSLFLDTFSILNEMFDVLGSGEQMSLFIALEQEESNEIIQSTVRRVLENRNIQYLRIRPHELIPCASLAMLEPDAVTEWRVPTFTLIILHLEGNLNILQQTLDRLEEALFFGDPIDLIFVVGVGASETERDLVRDFEWQLGHKSIRYLLRKMHYSEAAFEAYCALKTLNHYILVVDTKHQLSPMFYIWSKFETIALALDDHAPSSDKIMMCLTKDCVAPFHVFSAESWTFAVAKCSDILDSGKEDCASVFLKNYLTILPRFDLVDVVSKEESESPSLQHVYNLLPDTIKFREKRVEKLEKDIYEQKRQDSLERYREQRKKKARKNKKKKNWT